MHINKIKQKYFYRQSEGKYLIFQIHKFLRATFETEKSLSAIDVTHKLCYFIFNFIDITLLWYPNNILRRISKYWNA